MTRIKVVFLSAITLASAALFASVPDAYPGKFQVAMGKTVYVSLASEADGKGTPTFYKLPPKSGPFISFTLSAGVRIRTLVVTNKYDKSLVYKARMWRGRRTPLRERDGHACGGRNHLLQVMG